jgi:hypothetical protein
LALGVVPAIHVCVGVMKKDVDALLKSGHDESRFMMAVLHLGEAACQ